MRSKLILLFSLFVFAFSVTGGYAHGVKGAMSKAQISLLVADAYNAPASKFLSKITSDLGGKRGFRVVFVHNENRYTFDYNWWKEGVQVWVRPVGTSHPNPPADALADYDADGIVDFGADGHRIFAVADYYWEGSEAKGMEHKLYWQGIYNEALEGLKTALR